MFRHLTKVRKFRIKNNVTNQQYIRPVLQLVQKWMIQLDKGRWSVWLQLMLHYQTHNIELIEITFLDLYKKLK